MADKKRLNESYDSKFRKIVNHIKKIMPKETRWSYDDYRVVGDDLGGGIRFQIEFDSKDSSLQKRIMDSIEDYFYGVHCDTGWGRNWDYYISVCVDEKACNETFNKTNKLTLNEDLFEESNKPYKIRFYKLKGSDKGNLDHEEFFDTKKEAINRYREVFKKELFSLNPTVWELRDGDYKRLMNHELVDESLDEDLTLVPEEPSDETPATPEANGVAKLILDAINGETDTIKEYNDLIANTDNEDIIKIIQDITAEENNHIGMLQRALEIVSPNASNIDDGMEEAESMIEEPVVNAEPDFVPIGESLKEELQADDAHSLLEYNQHIQDTIGDMLSLIEYSENPDARKKMVKASFLISEAVEDAIGDRDIDESLVTEDVTKEWKPDTSFKHIKKVLDDAKKRGKYVNNEREEVLAAIDKADKKGYTPEQRKFIRDSHAEIWKKNRSVTEDIHDKFKRDIKTAYKKWASDVERVEAKRKEAMEMIPDNASKEQISQYTDFVNNKIYPMVSDFDYEFPHNIEKGDFPFYVTYYSEYPIYEPAEGGYYYAGRDAVWSQGFNSEEEARQFLDNFIVEDGEDWEQDQDGRYTVHGKYIGQDQTIKLEPNQDYLSAIAGWHPYE